MDLAISGSKNHELLLRLPMVPPMETEEVTEPMTRTVQTRFRDIPFEEAVKCHSAKTRKYASPEGWAQLRGQPILIETPGRGKDRSITFLCNGPFYRTQLVGKAGEIWVCLHVAEVGD